MLVGFREVEGIENRELPLHGNVRDDDDLLDPGDRGVCRERAVEGCNRNEPPTRSFVVAVNFSSSSTAVTSRLDVDAGAFNVARHSPHIGSGEIQSAPNASSSATARRP
jgi:hypothetical protein